MVEVRADRAGERAYDARRHRHRSDQSSYAGCARTRPALQPCLTRLRLKKLVPPRISLQSALIHLSVHQRYLSSLLFFVKSLNLKVRCTTAHYCLRPYYDGADFFPAFMLYLFSCQDARQPQTAYVQAEFKCPRIFIANLVICF